MANQQQLERLKLLNKVQTTPNNSVQAIFASTLAVGFAIMGARIVYRLGRDVAAARELGSYSLEERLGEGGMGEVWRARHRMLAPAPRHQADSPVDHRSRGHRGVGGGHVAPASPSIWGVSILAALDSLVLSCLAKDPNDRPQSARALSNQLAGIGGDDEDVQRGGQAAASDPDGCFTMSFHFGPQPSGPRIARADGGRSINRSDSDAQSATHE